MDMGRAWCFLAAFAAAVLSSTGRAAPPKASAGITVTPPPAALSVEAHQRALYAAAAPAVVFIVANDGDGSGFLVSPNGHIVTNAHVVGEQKTVTVVMLDGRRFDGHVTQAIDDIDLALVRIPIHDAPYLQLVGDTLPQVGAFAAAVGHGKGLAWTFNTGMISNHHHIDGRVGVLQTQVPVNPGNSGGPVLDIYGRVVGVVTAGDTKSQNLNFAIPTATIPRALPGLADVCDCVVLTAEKGQPIFVDGQVRGNGPRLVLFRPQKKVTVMSLVNGTMHTGTIGPKSPRRIDLTAPQPTGDK